MKRKLNKGNLMAFSFIVGLVVGALLLFVGGLCSNIPLMIAGGVLMTPGTLALLIVVSIMFWGVLVDGIYPKISG